MATKKGKSSKKKAPARARAQDAGLEKLDKLVRVLEKSGLGELSYEDKDIAVTLRRTGSAAATFAAPAPAPVPAAAAPSKVPEKAEDDDSAHVVHSPFVGTFYQAASPGEAAFAEVGKRVKKGQTLCIVEAMKLMNEIEAELDGKVLEILVENGQPVQYGDALFRIEPS